MKKQKVEVTCCSCNKQEIVYRRYKNKPKKYICKDCIEKKNNIQGTLTQCPECKRYFSFISTAHIKKCCNLTYNEFIEKYSRDIIYS